MPQTVARNVVSSPLGVDARPQGRRARPGLALLATSLGFGVVQLDVSVVNVAVKPIGDELGGSLSGLQWVVGAYTVAFAALILSAGALGDRIGAKRVFTTGFVLFTAASIACGLAPTLSFLIVARAVQGVGAAVLVPCSLALLGHAYPEARARTRAVGLWAAGASVGLSAGPLVGGLLIAGLGWRSIFFINVPLGVGAIWLTFRHASETTRSPERGVDLPGQTLAILALLSLAAATVEGGRRGFTDTLVLVGYAIAVIATASFAVVEAHRDKPMLPLGLFRSRTFSVNATIGLVINIAFYGLIFVLSLYFQSVRHYSPLVTGLAFAPTTAIVFLANVTSGRLVAAHGTRRVLVLSALLLAVSLVALQMVPAGAGYAAMVVPLLALGFGLGVIVPAMTSALLGSVDTSWSGVAAGTLNTGRQTGSVLGVALFGSLAAGGLTSGLRIALLISAGLALIVAALGGYVEDR
jgi:DHA2 family methylenomycin A resistance protein-like MFS transporter